jgi:serine/threonine protein phosphatase PrpC
VIRFSRMVESGDRGEDRVRTDRDGERLLVVVADGAGGTSGGADAAQGVCDAVIAAFRNGQPSKRWDERLKDIDSALASSPTGGQSTVVVTEICDGAIRGASVGDSGAWTINQDGITDLTAGQVRKPLMGTGAATPVAFEGSFGGRLLVGTDGLFKYTERARVAALAAGSALDEAVHALVNAARLKNGRLQDDITVVLCEEAPPVPDALAALQQRCREWMIPLNPGAPANAVAALESLLGASVPPDVRRFYETADGMVNHESDGESLVSFWSIERILRERDVVEAVDEGGPYRAVAFADVLIYSWCFRYKIRPGKPLVIVADGAPWEVPSLESFLQTYFSVPDLLGL